MSGSTMMQLMSYSMLIQGKTRKLLKKNSHFIILFIISNQWQSMVWVQSGVDIKLLQDIIQSRTWIQRNQQSNSQTSRSNVFDIHIYD